MNLHATSKIEFDQNHARSIINILGDGEKGKRRNQKTNSTVAKEKNVQKFPKLGMNSRIYGSLVEVNLKNVIY